jgi:hypothetical protein
MATFLQNLYSFNDAVVISNTGPRSKKVMNHFSIEFVITEFEFEFEFILNLIFFSRFHEDIEQ